MIHRLIPPPILNLYLSFRYLCWVAPTAKIYGYRNLKLSKGVIIEHQVIVRCNRASSVCSIGEGTRIANGAVLNSQNGYFSIGADCTINEYGVLYCSGGVNIGSHTRVASHVGIFASNHDTGKGKLLKSVTNPDGIRIGFNVWVGSKVTIVDGTTIGDDCIIAAHAMVKGDFGNNVVIRGIPALQYERI